MLRGRRSAEGSFPEKRQNCATAEWKAHPGFVARISPGQFPFRWNPPDPILHRSLVAKRSVVRRSSFQRQRNPEKAVTLLGVHFFDIDHHRQMDFAFKR